MLIGPLLQLDAEEEPASPDPVNLSTSSSNACEPADADEYVAPLALQQVIGPALFRMAAVSGHLAVARTFTSRASLPACPGQVI